MEIKRELDGDCITGCWARAIPATSACNCLTMRHASNESQCLAGWGSL